MAAAKKKPTGYDKYVDYRSFGIAVGAFVVLLLVPVPASMKDVAVEYSMGKSHVLDQFAVTLFGERYEDLETWQAKSAEILEASMVRGALSRKTALARDPGSVAKLGVEAREAHVERFHALVEGMDDASYRGMMEEAFVLRHETLRYDDLTSEEKEVADQAAWKLKLCVAMVAFVVLCFLTEAIPLPGVAFAIGLILVFGGVVDQKQVASLFWSDACWFIMGSLMFAAAFVKTGVDKRICLLIFRHLAKPSVAAVTAILILVIAPAASFISDHALAAMFLPVAVTLYSNSTAGETGPDRELAKMLVVCIAMACNIGGFGSPSGGARNVIMMTYLEDMFGITVGYGQWILYAMPFVLVMMPVLWLLLNWRFRPRVRDMGPALETLKKDIDRMGRWNAKQIIAVVIFIVMLLGWITEKNLLLHLTGMRLGIGVIAVAGAVAYLLTGVVNWRDYHEKVDWGVVWLYAGAIIFGRTLDETGTAYWMARGIVEGLACIGLSSGYALLTVGGAVTAGLTNLMADGPAAAAVGPITLNMAAVSSPGTTLTPFMGLVTACSSSFAYLLIIGTPPNAIVYASGYLEPRDYLRVGIPCLVVSFAVMLFLSLVCWPAIGFGDLAPM